MASRCLPGPGGGTLPDEEVKARGSEPAMKLCPGVAMARALSSVPAQTTGLALALVEPRRRPYRRGPLPNASPRQPLLAGIVDGAMKPGGPLSGRTHTVPSRQVGGTRPRQGAAKRHSPGRVRNRPYNAGRERWLTQSGPWVIAPVIRQGFAAGRRQAHVRSRRARRLPWPF